MQVETSIVVHAPPAQVRDTYADYRRWPRMFPTISAVRLTGHGDFCTATDCDM
jgi:carbon monoxide dehydrogenase subunit G